jgi:hypothetical protein
MSQYYFLSIYLFLHTVHESSGDTGSWHKLKGNCARYQSSMRGGSGAAPTFCPGKEAGCLAQRLGVGHVTASPFQAHSHLQSESYISQAQTCHVTVTKKTGEKEVENKWGLNRLHFITQNKAIPETSNWLELWHYMRG